MTYKKTMPNSPQEKENFSFCACDLFINEKKLIGLQISDHI
jgi:hypothetical protein